MIYFYYKWPIKFPPPILKLFTVTLYTLVKKFSNSQMGNNWKTDKENSNKPTKNTKMW